MKKVIVVLVLLILVFTGKGFYTIHEKALKERERQSILNSFNNDIDRLNGASKIVQDMVSDVGDILLSPTPDISLQEVIREQPELITVSEQPENSSNSMNENEDKPYKAIGRIQIDKIKVDYPILGTTTKETLDISITFLCGNGINQPGNVVLCGHNTKDGSLFGRLKELKEGDIIKLQDMDGITLKYKVYKIYIVEPTDLEPLNQDTDGKTIVTLITCTNKGKQRLIIKACSLE